MLQIKGLERRKGATCRPLERRSPEPISPWCRPLPVFRNRNI